MWHVVAGSVPGRWLCGSGVEGLEVWRMVKRVVPGVRAACVMPDHVHVVAPFDARRVLAQGLAGVARSRNARAGGRGALIQPLPAAVPLTDARKVRRAVRYVHLNPNRAGLVADPLAWPFSTHRDAVGLTWEPVGPRRGASFHRYVSSDPHVAVDGTAFPEPAVEVVSVQQVLVAVSNVLRVPVHGLGFDVLGRSVAWEACRVLCPTTNRELAGWLGVTGRTLRRRVGVPAELLAMVQRVAGDPRFGRIDGGPLPGFEGWVRRGYG